ncbi:MAG: hypothetical protein OEZ10_00990 [Gammaproteobacteria bacterium]|nr:hypothetical protein [Gammaproteobacteria bacterium]
MQANPVTPGDFRRILILTLIIGLVLLAWQSVRDTVVNNDAIRYLEMADAIINGDWQYAFSLYSMMLYSMLIALVQALLAPGIVASAYIVNGLLFAVFAWAFLVTIYRLGADRQIMTIAAVVLLLHPALLKYSSMIIRDHGFVAFFTLGMGNLLVYALRRERRWLYFAIAGLFVSGLFRFEGMVYVAALPILLLAATGPLSRHWKLLLTLGLVFAAGGLVAMYFWYTRVVPENTSGLKFFMQSSTYFLSALRQKADMVSTGVLVKYNADDAWLFILSGFLAILVKTVINRVTIIYGALSIHGLLKLPPFNQPDVRRLFVMIVGLNLLILFGSMLTTHLVVGRYTLSVVVMLLFPAVYSLNYLADNFRLAGKGMKTISVIVVLFITVSALQQLSHGESKPHIREAADWIAGNIDHSAVIASNSTTLLYHAGHSHMAKDSRNIAIGPGYNSWKKIRQSDYFAIVGKAGRKTDTGKINAESAGELVREFAGKSGQVLLYRTLRR